MRLNYFLAIAVLLSAAFGQLNRLFPGGDGAVIYLNDLLVGGLAVTYLGYALIVRRSWRIPPVMVGFWLFLTFGGLGLLAAWPVLGPAELAVSASYLVRYACYSFLFFVAYDAVSYASQEPQALSALGRWSGWVVLAGLLVALSGFIQLYLLPDLSILAQYGWDPHLNRLTTAMLDPNYAAAYLSIAAAVAISLFLYIQQPKVQIGLLAVTAVLLVAVLSTYSRSGYLMLAIAMGVIALFKSRWLLVVGTVLAVMALVLIPRVQQRVIGAFEIDDSASPRIVSWQNSWRIAADNQPLGVGYNSYRYAQDRYGILDLEASGNAGAGADSSWLFILATTGGLGFIAFGLSYLGLLWMSFKAWLLVEDPLGKAICLAWLAALLGLAAFSMFNNALFYTWILELFWVMNGLVAAIYQRWANRPPLGSEA